LAGITHTNAIELLTEYSGKDATKYQQYFQYSEKAKIVNIELHASGTKAMTARYTDEPLPYDWVNNILKIETADDFLGMSGVATYSVKGFNDFHFQEMKTVTKLLKNLKTLDPVEVRAALMEKRPDLSDEALSAIDIALWDLAARKAGLPLHRMLGSKRNEIKAYASIPFYETIPEHLAAVDKYMKLGFKTFKFHIWGRIEEDAKLVKSVNDKFANTEYRFMLDIENAYDYDGAIQLGNMLDKKLFIWLEAPINDKLFDQYRDLKNALTMSLIPTGYQFYSADFIRHGIKNNAWDAGRFDVTVVGGYSQALELMIIANDAKLPIEVQSWGPTLSQAANLHLILANERTTFFEAPTPKEAFEFGMSNGDMLNEGKIIAPKGSGLGIKVDWDKLSTADFYRSSN